MDITIYYLGAEGDLSPKIERYTTPFNPDIKDHYQVGFGPFKVVNNVELKVDGKKVPMPVDVYGWALLIRRRYKEHLERDKTKEWKWGRMEALLEQYGIDGADYAAWLEGTVASIDVDGYRFWTNPRFEEGEH